ncbi:hypothetical protein AB0940_20915 [Streptomyces sp. NPDC006656]|uniref:scabin-related ADP-ribosyltransferase n=1 Tax=Streptomyces sp. NPDC006656 TaxID=3156899 RepID=UPI003453152A
MGRHAMLRTALRVLAAAFALSAATLTPSAAAAQDDSTAPCGPVVDYRAADWWRTTTNPAIAPTVASTAASERWQWRDDINTLWRGDTRENVEEIFRTGFTPRGDQLIPLAEYIVKGGGQLSAHLSTSCDPSVAKRFATYGAEKTGWVYEIYAPGGIDVNATARVNSYQSPYLWNKEIDFPGGVRGNFIKGACKYRLTGTDPVTNDKTWEQLGCKDNAGFAPYRSDPAAYALTH